jgi:hypothetical protein
MQLSIKSKSNHYNDWEQWEITEWKPQIHEKWEFWEKFYLRFGFLHDKIFYTVIEDGEDVSCMID